MMEPLWALVRAFQEILLKWGNDHFSVIEFPFQCIVDGKSKTLPDDFGNGCLKFGRDG
jgi:hypothetical protein